MERISQSNAALEGKNNAYLFADGPETVLIDTGDRMEATREQLQSGLATYGVTFEDIDRVLLTHWHHDHTGLAGDIQDQSGADIYVHANDAPLVEGDETSWEELWALQSDYFERWGIPAAKQQTLRESLFDPDFDNMPTVIPFEAGDEFVVNDYTLEVIHTSGHAAGLSMFEMDSGGESVVFAGDALLPVYTPNVGGADVRVQNALAKYLGSLRDIVDAKYDRAWPGHRNPIEDPAARAREIIHHHEERAWRVLTTLQEHGPLNPWQLGSELFGDLDGVHIIHGPGETFAHLEHLEQTEVVKSEGDTYQLAPDIPAELEQLDDNSWNLGF